MQVKQPGDTGTSKAVLGGSQDNARELIRQERADATLTRGQERIALGRST